MLQKLLVSCASLCLGASLLLAHSIPQQGVQVNSYTTGDQVQPRVAVNQFGTFLVVWSGDGAQDGSQFGVFGRLIDHFGVEVRSEFQVNSTVAGNQYYGDVALAPSGEFMVAWTARPNGYDFGIMGQALDSTGAPVGAEFQVNSYTTGEQAFPALAGLPGGEFIVVWDDQGGSDGSYGGIKGRRFDSTGSALGGEFQVNSYTADSQRHPAVAANADGEFVVAWSGAGPGDSYGIFARRFDSGGSPMGIEILVNSTVSGNQLLPALGADALGAFVVAWEGFGAGDPQGVFARRFDSGGLPQGGEFAVNFHTESVQRSPDVGMEPGGLFVVTWQSYGEDGSGQGVFGQVFHPGGLRSAGNFRLNGFTAGSQARPSVSADPNHFVVVWESEDQDGSDYGVFHRRFLLPPACTLGDGDGDLVCESSDNCPGRANADQQDENRDRVGDACDISITNPSSTDLLDCSNPKFNQPTIQWDPADYDRFKVFLSTTDDFLKKNRVSSGDWKPFTSWSPNRKKWRRACAKALVADPNSPHLHIRVQGKNRSLSKKNPARKTFSPEVEVDVQP